VRGEIVQLALDEPELSRAAGDALHRLEKLFCLGGFGLSPAEGFSAPSLATRAAAAQPALFAATSPKVAPSGYYGPKNVSEMKGPATEAKIAPRQKKAVAARTLGYLGAADVGPLLEHDRLDLIAIVFCRIFGLRTGTLA
jgi:hypothetical protein